MAVYSSILCRMLICRSAISDSFLFDFSYDKKVSNEDLQKVETLCNELIAKNMQVYVEEA